MTTVVECIDTNDMETVLGILSPKSPSHELRRRVEEAGKNKFGMIEYDEFRAWISKTDVYVIFKTFDKGGKGLIDVADMETIFEALDQSWTPEKMHKVLKEAGLSGDGKIDYEQFLTWAFKHGLSEKDREETALYTPEAKKQIDTQALEKTFGMDKENMKVEGANTGEEPDLLRWGGYPKARDEAEEDRATPTTPIRSSSRQLDCGGASTDVTELAKKLCALDESMTIEKAQQLVEHAHRSLIVFPAI